MPSLSTLLWWLGLAIGLGPIVLGFASVFSDEAKARIRMSRRQIVRRAEILVERYGGHAIGMALGREAMAERAGDELEQINWRRVTRRLRRMRRKGRIGGRS